MSFITPIFKRITSLNPRFIALILKRSFLGLYTQAPQTRVVRPVPWTYSIVRSLAEVCMGLSHTLACVQSQYFLDFINRQVTPVEATVEPA